MKRDVKGSNSSKRNEGVDERGVSEEYPILPTCRN